MIREEGQTLSVFIVDDESTARNLFKRIHKIDKDNKNFKIVDSAIANRTKRRVKVKQMEDVGGMKGGVGGGAIGVLVGAIVLGPAGAIIGGLSGGTLSGLYTYFRDKGISDRTMRKTAKELTSGKSALFVLHEGSWDDSRGAIDDAVRVFHAEMIANLMTPTQIAAVQPVVDTAVHDLGGKAVVSDYEVQTEESTIPPVDQPKAAPDDFTLLIGLDEKSVGILHAAGIQTYTQLAQINDSDLRQIFKDKSKSIPANIQMWPMQASFAEKGDWTGLYKYNQLNNAELVGYTLATFALANEESARALLKSLQTIAKADNQFLIVDAAIATWSKKGRIQVKQMKYIDHTKGTVGGGGIGVLVGAMVLGPIGAAIGGVTGGVMAGLYTFIRDEGIEDKFMKNITKELKDGKNGLFVQYAGDWSASKDAIKEAVKTYDADMLYTTLSAEQVAEIQDVVETAVEELGGDETVTDYEVDAVANVEEAAETLSSSDDDLTILTGIGAQDIALLTAVNVTTYAQLAESNEAELQKIFTDAETAVPANIHTWATQATFVQNGDWPGLIKYNQNSTITDNALFEADCVKSEDLTQLEGIGPKLADILITAGYDSYESLAHSNEPQLRQVMRQAKVPSPASLPTWPMQAAYAEQGDWQGLFKYNQKRRKKMSTQKTAMSTVQTQPSPIETKPDDLTQIHGIGPRISTILAAGGITTYSQLENMSPERLREILLASGVLTPASLATWPSQAAYASKGDWQGLFKYNQKQAQKKNNSSAPISVVQTPLAKPDDLTQIHGIGPRIATLLASAGIMTYGALESTPVNQLQDIMNENGVLPPSTLKTWPTQANYAMRGDWQGLTVYTSKL